MRIIDICRDGCKRKLGGWAESMTGPATRAEVRALYTITILIVVLGMIAITSAIEKSEHTTVSRRHAIIASCRDQNARNQLAVEKIHRQAAQQIGKTTSGSPAAKARLQRAITAEREELINVELPVRNCEARADALTR